MRIATRGLVLRGGARLAKGSSGPAGDIHMGGGRVTPLAVPETDAVDISGHTVLPALVNAHDHLDFSTFPPLGRPPYASVYDWSDDVAGGVGDADAQAALLVPPADRLFLGGVRNLLAGATSVVHHNPFHRSLTRPDFPVRVLERYQFAHSPGLTARLRKTYRSTDRRIPWFIHLAEGVDARCRAELSALVEANLMRHNVVAVHGIALGAEEARALAEAEACVVWCPESNRHLYGATAPVAVLRAAGVRLALGSDSPASGVRDPLSNLAAARREGAFSDDELIDLATRASGEVARLPAGGLEPGDLADLVVVESKEALLRGERATIALVVREGRRLYGRRDWMVGGARVVVDGAERALDYDIGARAGALVKRHPSLRQVPWLRGIEW